MDIPTTPGSDESRVQQSPVRVSDGGIHIMKVASTFGEHAVAVDLTIRSDRSDRCEIRVTDVLPEAVRDNHVEFHPKYDPDHWTREDDQVVYRAPIGPGIVRRTVYGVTIDDQSQLASFSTEPMVVVTDESDEAADGGRADSSTPAAGSEFSFGRSERGAEPDSHAGDVDGAHLGDIVTQPADEVTDDPVAALVSELQRRELSQREQTVLRHALGIDADREVLQSLTATLADVEADLEALQRSMTTTGGPDEDLGPVEARLDELSAEVQSVSTELSADLDDLRAALEREVRWRTRLRRSLVGGNEEP